MYIIHKSNRKNLKLHLDLVWFNFKIDEIFKISGLNKIGETENSTEPNQKSVRPCLVQFQNQTEQTLNYIYRSYYDARRLWHDPSLVLYVRKHQCKIVQQCSNIVS